jgi:hypothetical protein
MTDASNPSPIVAFDICLDGQGAFGHLLLEGPSDGQTPLRGAGDKYSSSSVVVLLEETKICPKEMEIVVCDGWTRPGRVRENSNNQ